MWLSLLGGLLLLAGRVGLSTASALILREVAAGVFVHLGQHVAPDAPGHDDIANIGFVVGSTCVAVIDSGGSDTVGRELRSAIGARSRLPVCYVINTHVHYDHLLGNSAFAPDHPVFVGSATLPAAVARSRQYFKTHYAGDLDLSRADPIIGPDRTVERDLTLDLGDRTLALHAWPTAHTDCDLTVEDLKTRTLWAGDLLFRERLPVVDGSVKGWLTVLDELAKMRVDHVIPGHGDPTGDFPGAVGPQWRYLQALVAGVRAELGAGQPMQHAIEHVALAERDHWLLWNEAHPRNVARVYQELEWE